MPPTLSPGDQPDPTLLIAPDSFKGTWSAREVALALASGAQGIVQVDLCPLADGGEGTMEILLEALGGELLLRPAHDPLGRAIEAPLALLGDGGLAVVEAAAASGLGLLDPGERDAEAASSAGTGELIAAAAAAGARVILLAAGGSATTDGGAGAIAAIEQAGGLPAGARLIVLADVRTPFERAAEVYGPQKGADEAAVERLSARLELNAQSLPRDPRGRPMSGAAGGLSGGLWAACGAELTSGAAWVLDAVRFDERLAAATAVLTGEGRIDAQTLQGKLVSEVARRGAGAGVPVHAVAGSCELGEPGRAELGLASVRAAGTPGELQRAGRELAAELAAGVELTEVPAQAVRELRREVLRPGQSASELNYTGDEDPSSLHLAALRGGRIVAVASIMRQGMPGQEAAGDWRLRGMASTPQMRGRGIGSALLAGCLQHAREHGARRVWCNARVGARSFYERAGLSVHGEPFDVPPIGMHLLMSVELEPGPR